MALSIGWRVQLGVAMRTHYPSEPNGAQGMPSAIGRRDSVWRLVEEPRRKHGHDYLIADVRSCSRS